MELYYLSRSEISSNKANTIQVLQMCDAFCRNGHDITLYGIDDGGDKRNVHSTHNISADIRIKTKKKQLNNRFGNLLYSATVGYDLNTVPKPDLYYGRDVYSLVTTINSDVPLCLESHQPPPHKLRHSIEKIIFKSDNFCKLIVISESLKQRYLKQYNILDESDVLVAHDGARSIDLDRAHSVELLGRSDSLDIGYVGSLYPGKGASVIPEIARQVPDHDFHIVGGYVDDLDISHNPENLYFYGSIPHSEVENYLRSFDILTAPYQKEVLPNPNSGHDISQWMSPLKIFEYMAARKPIICSDLSVLKEILVDDRNALLVPPDEMTEWVTAIQKLENENLRERLGGAAYQQFKEKYTWKKRSERILSQIMVDCDIM